MTASPRPVPGHDSRGAQARLGRWAHGRMSQALTGLEHERLGLLLRDHLACAAGGAETELGQRIRAAYPRAAGGCLVVGDDARADMASAAFLNGFSAHILDYDDVHVGSILHAGAPVFAGLMALSDADAVPAARLAPGALIGYEVAVRLGSAAGPGHYARHHSTGTVTAVAAAAALAAAMGGDTEEISSAMGLAATQAAGLWAFRDGAADSKPLHAGHAAWVGLVSARMARGGLHGATDAIESEAGFLATLGGDRDSAAIEPPEPGEPAAILDVSLKPYRCCGHTFPGLLAALRLHGAMAGEGRAAAQIRSGTIQTYGAATLVAGRRNPATPAEAAFSYGFLVAHMLAHGDLAAALSEAAPAGEGVRDAGVHALAEKLSLVADEAMTRRYPASQPVTITLTFEDGRQLSQSAQYGLGAPQMPLSAADHRRKVLELTHGRADWIDEIAERMLGDAP